MHPKYDLTFPQFCESYLQESRYKEKYQSNPILWENHKESVLLSSWKQILLERAKEEPLRYHVIQSFMRMFGEKALWSTFRGQYEKGVSQFRIPRRTSQEEGT